MMMIMTTIMMITMMMIIMIIIVIITIIIINNSNNSNKNRIIILLIIIINIIIINIIIFIIIIVFCLCFFLRSPNSIFAKEKGFQLRSSTLHSAKCLLLFVFYICVSVCRFVKCNECRKFAQCFVICLVDIKKPSLCTPLVYFEFYNNINFFFIKPS